MSDFKQTAQSLTPEIYASFKTAIELGKWPDGRVLSNEQRNIVMEAIIHYESQHVAETERTGVIADSCKSKSAEAIDSVDKIAIQDTASQLKH